MRSDINLNLLYSLNALLETRNLTRAAEQLGLTQSAMSRHLIQLRSQFKDPLLLREGQRFVLTERAQALRGTLKSVLENIAQLYLTREFDPKRFDGAFSFAGSDYLAEYMFPDILERVMQQAPHIRVSFHAWRANYFNILLDEKMDLVATIADEIPENVYGKSLGQDKPICVMAADHPLRDRRSVTQDDYTRGQHIHISGASDKDSFIDQFLARANLKRDIRIETPYFLSALNIVARSQLLLTIPEHLAARFMRQFPLCAKPIAFIDHTYRYWLLWHGRVDKDPAHRWFRDHAYEVLYHSIHGVAHYADSAW